MIGVLILSHGQIGQALLASAGQILGTAPERVAVLGVSRADDPEALLERARALVGRIDDGGGVLVLTDLYGATPGNVAGRLLADGRVEGVSGLSLPMLMRVLGHRNGSLAQAVARAVAAGAEGVVHMNADCCRDEKR